MTGKGAAHRPARLIGLNKKDVVLGVYIANSLAPAKKDERERRRCVHCGKHVLVKERGGLRGHNSRPGITCPGGNPTQGY